MEMLTVNKIHVYILLYCTTKYNLINKLIWLLNKIIISLQNWVLQNVLAANSQSYLGVFWFDRFLSKNCLKLVRARAATIFY